MPKEQSLLERYPERTRNKPSFDRQDKLDDNLNHTIDYCYKLANIPLDHQQAIESPKASKWQEAMNTEMNALKDNDTFELVPGPKDRQIVGAKWVYTIKTDQNEKETYKARFVAKNHLQIPDIDYQETFAPIARMSKIRTLLQHAVQNDLIVYQMDVKTAYLNAPIDREIYVEQPEGFRKSGNSGETLVCKLKRSLYGLKQSGRNWSNLLHDYLANEKFTQSLADPCLYVRTTNSGCVIIIVWVDDIIIAATDSDLMTEVKESLRKRFKMKHLGSKMVLGNGIWTE